MTEKNRWASSGGLALTGGALGLVAVVGEFVTSDRIMWSGLFLVVWSLVIWQIHRRRRNADHA
jgi:hypothetical protein